MAFIAAGVSIVHQIENLPKAFAGLIQISILYIDYLGFYLLNGRIPVNQIWMFTLIFVAVFAVIWLAIYLLTRRNVNRMNEMIGRECPRIRSPFRESGPSVHNAFPLHGTSELTSQRCFFFCPDLKTEELPDGTRHCREAFDRPGAGRGHWHRFSPVQTARSPTACIGALEARSHWNMASFSSVGEADSSLNVRRITTD